MGWVKIITPQSTTIPCAIYLYSSVLFLHKKFEVLENPLKRNFANS